jgi:hypothetical protein
LEGLAEDVALFDQRGCLSPRVLLVAGPPELALDIARELSRSLAQLEIRIPRGRLAPDEAAELTRYRDTARYTGELLDAGLGFVSTSAHFLLPPIGRNVHVLSTNDPVAMLAGVATFVTSYAVAAADPSLRAALARALPFARACRFGQMQRPPFDGPVDRRPCSLTPRRSLGD